MKHRQTEDFGYVSSLALDSRTPYFDCGKPSDLEELLKTYDFEADRRSWRGRAPASTS